MEKVYERLARLAHLYNGYMRTGGTEMAGKQADKIVDLVEKYMPSGSGINAGTEFDWRSTGNKLIFQFEYHHIKNDQYYEVTIHNVFVHPSLMDGISIRITGFKDGDLEDYCYQTFRKALDTNLEE